MSGKCAECKQQFDKGFLEGGQAQEDANRKHIIKPLQKECEQLKAANSSLFHNLTSANNEVIAIRGDFAPLKAENERFEEALEKIITESGKVDITNWPAQQQICQAIARKALEGDKK